jgi:hypothetical protein
MTTDERDDAAREDGDRPTQAGPSTDRRAAGDGPDADLVLALSPRQILGGFALLAALVMLLRRRNRDRDSRPG